MSVSELPDPVPVDENTAAAPLDRSEWHATASDSPSDSAQEQLCTGEHCVTCSDEAVRVTVSRLLDDGLATVDTGSTTEEISVALVAVDVGDTVLVHAGEAIAVVKE